MTATDILQVVYTWLPAAFFADLLIFTGALYLARHWAGLMERFADSCTCRRHWVDSRCPRHGRETA